MLGAAKTLLIVHVVTFVLVNVRHTRYEYRVVSAKRHSRVLNIFLEEVAPKVLIHFDCRVNSSWYMPFVSF